jgi:hypothetical protein
MKKIKLTKGKFALVDDEDFEYLNQWRWNVSTSGYARRLQYIKSSGYGNKDYTTVIVTMHRLINQTPDELFTDHINQNKLDNRKSNLRTVTKSQNGINRGKNKNNKSGYKGIYWDTWSEKWRAEIMTNSERIRLGRFVNIKDAVSVRKQAELKYHAI